MSNDDIAAAVLECVGGFSNVEGNSLCATRLRITLRDVGKVNRNALHSINGVLGLADRGASGIEVVFGPNLVRGVYRSFERLTGLFSRDHNAAEPRKSSTNFQVKITPETPGAPLVRGAGARGTTEEIVPPPPIDDDTNALLEMLDVPRVIRSSGRASAPTPDEDEETEDAIQEQTDDAVQEQDLRPRLVVVNGPNVNLYGQGASQEDESYATLLEVCRASALDAGFACCDCYQSNHEGDLIDCIQDACGAADAIVINAGGYAYSSIALLDALIYADIPAIEVQLPRPIEGNGLPWQSYVGRACLTTITGQGVEGYRIAIYDLAQHLGMH